MMKKTSKKLFLLVLLCALMAFPLSASAATQKWNNVVSKYNSYLRTHTVSYSTKTIYDIDKDGYPEMILTYPAGVRTGMTIYTVKNHKVKYAGSLQGLDGSVVSKWKGNKKYIVVEWSNSAFNSGFTVCRMNNGKLKQGDKFESVSDMSTGKITYLKNGKKISKNAFYKAYRKIGKSIA